MKLKYNFVVNNVAGTTLAVPVGNAVTEFKGYIKLNDTAAFIFKAIMKEQSREEIISGILSEFEGVTDEEAENAVDEFLEELRKADVLDD